MSNFWSDLANAAGSGLSNWNGGKPSILTNLLKQRQWNANLPIFGGTSSPPQENMGQPQQAYTQQPIKAVKGVATKAIQPYTASPTPTTGMIPLSQMNADTAAALGSTTGGNAPSSMPQSASGPNITIPYSQGGQYRLPPDMSQILLNAFNASGQATNAAQVLNHPRMQTYTPSEIQSIGHPSYNYGENASFRPSNVDATNSNGSVDRGLMRINSDTFNGMMSNPATKAKMAKLGITNWNDMEDPQKNAYVGNLIQQTGGWRRWYAAPLSLRQGK